MGRNKVHADGSDRLRQFRARAGEQGKRRVELMLSAPVADHLRDLARDYGLPTGAVVERLLSILTFENVDELMRAGVDDGAD